MKVIRLALGSILFLALFATASLAQVQRTFASASGSDGNPCSRSAPCRTLAQAISQTNAGGEVIVLDSAGYGPLTITKSITVTAAPGVYAGISVFSGDGIDVNAGSADVVVLRGLTVNNQGSTGGGIVANTVGTLRIEGCVVRGFSFAGGISLLSASKLSVKDSSVADCEYGIFTNPGSGTAQVTIDHITVGCLTGVEVGASGTGTALGAIRDSSVTDCVVGISTFTSGPGATALLDVERCLVTNNETGLITNPGQGGNSAISISNCVITHNSHAGFFVFEGTTMYSRGNNTIGGNGPNGEGALTLFPGQ